MIIPSQYRMKKFFIISLCMFGAVILIAFNLLTAQELPDTLFSNTKSGNISTNSATVSTETSEPVLLKVEYGLDTNYGQIVDVDHVDSLYHYKTISGLQSDSEYHYRFVYEKIEDEFIYSDDSTFCTLIRVSGESNTAPEAIIQVIDRNIFNNQIIINKNDGPVSFVGSNSIDSDGDELSYYWTFGDGEVSVEADPTHQYEAEGTYSVKLSVDDNKWSQYDTNPFTIQLQQPRITGRGGILVHDVNNDGLLDYLVTTKSNPLASQTSRATIGVYDHYGSPLWIEDVDIRINGNAENYGLPGWSGPGITAADIDGDGQVEVLHLDTQSSVVIRNGLTGEVERTIFVALNFDGASRWGLIQIVNLRGRGEKDLILQADPESYDSEQNLFQWLTAISLETGEVLWEVDDYFGVLHGGFRAVDIDNDGLDEVVGGVLIDHDGTRMNSWNYRDINGHLDAITVADLKPDVPGLEVLIAEELSGSSDDDRVAILNPAQVFTYASRDGDEPQNLAVGEFDLNEPGLEIWCRSRYDFDQQPWVLNSDGDVISEWIMNEKKLPHWSTTGVEFIYNIDWDGGDKQLIAATERHVDGKIAIIDPMTGEFVRWWEEQAIRIHVADVAGDYREEIIIINSSANEIKIYWNEAANFNSSKPRYWKRDYYKRLKENYNYYSP